MSAKSLLTAVGLLSMSVGLTSFLAYAETGDLPAANGTQGDLMGGENQPVDVIAPPATTAVTTPSAAVVRPSPAAVVVAPPINPLSRGVAPRKRGLDLGNAEAASSDPQYPNQTELTLSELGQMVFNSKVKASTDGKELIVEYDAYNDDSSRDYQCGSKISFVGPDFKSDGPAKGSLVIRAKDDGFRACRENFKDKSGYISCTRTMADGKTKNFCRHFTHHISLDGVDVPASLGKVDLVLAWRKGNSDEQSAPLIHGGIMTARMIEASKYKDLIAQMDGKHGFDPTRMQETIERAQTLNLIDQNKVNALKKFVDNYKKEQDLKAVDEQITTIKDDAVAGDSGLKDKMEELAKIAKEHPERKKEINEAAREMAQHYVELAGDEDGDTRASRRKSARYLTEATEALDKLKKAGVADSETIKNKLEIQRDSITMLAQNGDSFTASKLERSFMKEANSMYSSALKKQQRACRNSGGGKNFQLENCADASDQVALVREIITGQETNDVQQRALATNNLVRPTILNPANRGIAPTVIGGNLNLAGNNMNLAGNQIIGGQLLPQQQIGYNPYMGNTLGAAMYNYYPTPLQMPLGTGYFPSTF